MTQPKSVLVVDDDRQVLKYLTELLREAGYDTVTCERFTDAKALLCRPRARTCCSPTSAWAPTTACSWPSSPQSRHPGIPVIVLTGYEDPTLREEAAASGATFLVKPVRREELLAKIAAAMAAAGRTATAGRGWRRSADGRDD